MADAPDGKATSSHRDNLTANINGTGDFVIELKYCKWAVHQEKFVNASAFFRKALEGDQWKEAHEHHIKLHDDCPVMFARCIQFLYRGKYAYHSRPMRSWFEFNTQVCENVDLRYLVFGRPVCGVFDTGGDETDEFESDEDDTIRIRRTDRWKDYVFRSELDEDAYNKAINLEIQKQADIKSDMWKYRAEVDIAMHRLADKYLIPSLQDYALISLQKSIRSINSARVTYTSVFKALNEAYPDYELLDERLKRTIAVCIARDYKAIRTMDDDAATTIRDWLHSDAKLCFMVMDHFARIADIGKEESNR